MENKAKNKAEELVEEYKDFVHGYVGSSMLTNYEYPEQIFRQASRCALICVEEIIKAEPRRPNNVDWDDCGGTHKYYYEEQRKEALVFWEEVRDELNKMK